MFANPPFSTIPEPLKDLHGRPLGPFYLNVTQCEPMARRSGWRRVTFFLIDGDDVRADWPLIKGFYSVAGRQRGSWLDCDFHPLQSFKGKERNLTNDGLALEFFRLLGEAVTSHCMVAYEVWEHATDLHAFTEQSYRLGIPPGATPIGELLIAAGCITGFKDWYIAEGGNEGPRKLQAEKPATDAARAHAMASLARSLADYLARRPVKGAEEVELDCRRRALRLLKELGDWPEAVRSFVEAVAAAAAGAEDLLRDGPARVRQALEERRPHWSLEDGP